MSPGLQKLSCCMTLWVLASASPASAQTKPASADACDLPDAQARGECLFQAGRFQEARDAAMSINPPTDASKQLLRDILYRWIKVRVAVQLQDDVAELTVKIHGQPDRAAL